MENKSNKGLIIIIVVLIILLLGAVSYICYDKGVFDGVLGKDTNEPKEEQEVKLTDEEVAKLHESLLNADKNYGFYFKDKIDIDAVTAETIMPYVMLKYAEYNNIKE